MPLQLSTAEFTAAGPRKENQDAVRIVTPAPRLAASKGHLLALADGVSQCHDGGLAARATLQALALDYYSTPETWSVVQALEKLLTAHNRWLRANGGGQPLLTTLTAVVLRGTRYTLAHVGDCRAYLLRDGRLRKLTSEHVWEQPGMQHVLKRAMGLDEHLLMDYCEGDLRRGDRFLVLSDGVWASLDDLFVHQQLLGDSDPQVICESLAATALQRGSQDNVSALLVDVLGLPESNLTDVLEPIDERALPPRLKAGQTFEGWEVAGDLAESRQSLIYRVRDPLQQNWLLKTLPPQRQDDADACRDLVLEEWFMRRVAGQHTPELHPLPSRQHLYYVMREHPGMTLEQHKREHGLLSVALCQQIAAKLVRGIGLLHRRNLVHRDIKPDNLLLDDDGVLRILDFGLAFCPGLSSPERAGTPGTPSYIAPEVFAGAEPAPPQDLYSAGVALYYLLTGHYPYGEIEAFQRPRFGRPAPPSRYRPDIPPWLDDCLIKAVETDPEKRYETAEEWLLALEQGERRSLNQSAVPLLEREPLLVWRGIALGALALNLVLIAVMLH
ncbi:bifunctional protein-serine/threonine kinase/phosphatase [Halopseudomonas nanhaiensis]|uniref:bifunctional protein-serine/threonine kinase/phosphatase n=1 Tax=Halopseudomonas nanhaiensis TaxID=2830842 RepID=UPI001CC0BB73|nr:bifunctional protein-serine/threonine kinase/phosphatase [Halopseudomonas nanhaiensis]UAW99551.1 bifunctional protein-serine/threonine kinase/phosphatase [Halopseudomonas nanhaiensis]